MRPGRVLALLCTLLALLIVVTAPWPLLQQTLSDLLPTPSPPTTCPNLAPEPDYYASGGEQAAIGAINRARGLEGLPQLNLPTNYWRLSSAQQQFVLVNLERAGRGLPVLRWDATLAQIATAYSQQMVQLHFFAHTSPISGDFPTRLEANPHIAGHYAAIAENIAGNWAPAAGAMYEYLYHDATEQCAHRQNLLNPTLQMLGIGVVEGGPWGAISAQEFLASDPANPYRGGPPDTTPPTIHLNTVPTEQGGVTLITTATDDQGVAQISWYLDGFGHLSHQGATWTLTTSMLAPGPHQLNVYAVDTSQNYADATFSLLVGAQGITVIA